MADTKPFSPSCERNKDPILGVLKQILLEPPESGGLKAQVPLRLLEIGSGTGQHAVYFAPHFPKLRWVTSDRSSEHAGILGWLNDAKLLNVEGPLELEIGRNQISKYQFDVVFSANVLHIISWELCQHLFQMLGESLAPHSQVLFYGPFNYEGNYTSTSNADFDQWLKARDPKSAIRAFEDVQKLMREQGFVLRKDYQMPSNNRILHFQKL